MKRLSAVGALCVVGAREAHELLMDHPAVEKRLARLAELDRRLGKPTL